MSEHNKHQDFTKVSKANRAMLFRLVAAGFVLYMFLEILFAYFKGGPDAPSPALLLAAAVVLGGGTVFILFIAFKAWKAEKAAAEMTEEEVAEMEALREEET